MDLRDLPPELYAGAAALALLLALVQTLRLAFRRWSTRRRLGAMRERGAQGEVRAEALLVRRGYAILGRQVSVTYEVGVDGGSLSVDLRADYLVSKGGHRYVAEVKTGRLAPRLDTPATRRQLLEYNIAFDVSGVLLVDAESDRVHRVIFPLPDAGAQSPRAGAWLAWLAAGLALGLGAAALARGLG